MPRSLKGVLLLTVLLAAVAVSTPRPTATPEPTPAVLESAALKLEVTRRPYRYRLFERSTGRLLVSHLSTDVRLGDASPESENLGAIEKTADGLEAKLDFSNAARGARIRFRFTAPEILEVRVDDPRGPLTNVTETFADQGEHYYGIWEHIEGGLDLRGADQELLGLRHVSDNNYPSARAPFYVTSRGYGIYTHSEARGRYKIAVRGRTVASFDDTALRYSIVYGPSYAQVFQRYNDLCGGASLPPTWAFDSIWWRDDNHRGWEGTKVRSAQELVLHDADSLRQHRIPASALWLDRPYSGGRYGWGRMDFDEGFPDPAGMIAALRERGLNLLLWIANRSANGLLEEGVKNGYLFAPEIYTDWPAADLRQPAAYDWFKQKLDAYVSLGVKGYKIDRGEEGEMPDAVQNQMVTLFAKLAKEGLEARHPNDSLVFARNIYDTGRKYAAVWNGDSEITWSGFTTSIKHALRSGAINMPMWGSDVGGYHNGTLTKELFARWFQFGAYSTMMEVKIGPGRTPWLDFDAELVGIARAQSTAHHELIPYTRSAVYNATRTGFPVMRQLFFDYPDTESLADTWDEYMFGPSLLVAPVYEDGARRRKVYLPEGRWLDYNARRTVHAGGTTITAEAPLDTIPVFVKEGAIVPRGDIIRSNIFWRPWQPQLRLEVFAPREGTTTFPYFTGAAVTPITSTVSKGTLTLTFDDLGHIGAVEIVMKAHGAVSLNGEPLREGAGMTYDPERQALLVAFQGPTRLVVEGVQSLF
jgi:alpha-D-xyloside xylohydrolase